MPRKAPEIKQRVHLRKRGNVWWFDYSVNGRRVQRSTKTRIREQAELKRAALEVKLFESDGLFDPRNRCTVTLDAFSERFLDWSKQNKRSYRRDRVLLSNLQAHFGRLLLDRITPADVEAYKQRRLNGDLVFGDRPRTPSKATVNRELSRLRRVLNLAVEWGELDVNPLAGKLRMFKEAEGRVRYLTAEQAALLLSKCSDHLQPVVHLAMLAGMRKTEITGLRWGEVDLSRGVVHLPGARTKNGRARNVPLSGQARALLRAQEAKRPEGCEWVFIRPPIRRRNRPVDKKWEPLGSIRKGFTAAVRRAHLANEEARKEAKRPPNPPERRLAGLHFHDLRHCFASAMVQRGVSLQAVGELLGHRTLAMTQRYAHLSPQVLQGAVEQAARYLAGEASSEPPALAVIGTEAETVGSAI